MEEIVKIVLFSLSLTSEDDLAIRCAEITKNSGCELIIIAKSPRVKSWAQEHNITFFEPALLINNLLTDPVDYLFNIASSQDFLQYCSSIPTKSIIHYGNSLSSDYSKYAYTKAILENKETHGIFWGMRDHADTTELYSVIQQVSFPIGTNETAFSLRQKTQKHAAFEFSNIIERIKHKNLHFSKQPLTILNQPIRNTLETIFKRTFIHWNIPAEEIEKSYRALNFESQENPIGLLKLSLGEKVLSLKGFKILESSSKASPGTILSISKDELHIATTTQDIAIKDFYSSNGFPFPVKRIVNHYKLAEGCRLINPDHLFVKEFAHIASECTSHEAFWVKALTNIIPGIPPLSTNAKRAEKTKSKMVGFFKMETSVFTQLLGVCKKKENEGLADINVSKKHNPMLLTLILMYLYRLNNYQEYTIRFSDQDTQNQASFRNFFASYLPVTINFDSNMSFINSLEKISLALHQLKENKTYARDISLRYAAFTMESTTSLISILVSDSIKTPKLLKTSALTIVINQKGTEFGLYAKKDVLPNLDVLASSLPTHIMTMITNIIKQPSTPIHKLAILTTPETQKILLDWNNTKVNFKNSHKPIHCLFEEQTLKTPHRIAVTFENKSLTYLELNQKSDQIAQYLTNLGVAPDTIVAICAKRSLEMVMGILGILKSGCAYLPLDPNYPADRLGFMLSDSKALTLLTDTFYPSIRSNKNINTIKIQQIFSQINIEEDIKAKNVISSKNLAYVIYTSGTTDIPKGVAVTHASLVNHMLWMLPKFNFTENDVFLQKTPFSFDASIWELFAPLLCGGKLVMAPEELTDFSALIKKHNITILQLVPSMLRELLQEQEFQYCDSLQQVFSGGEALLPDTISLFFKKMQAKLRNLYGPTETTIQVTTCNYDDPCEKSTNSILIGKPIDNVQVYVLDKYLNPMPVGAIGELYIGGLCLAQGYLNREDLTKERFVQNPFEAHSRLYKTGDTVRWLIDGNLEYIGRADDQLKFNGFRIEIGEIEANLLKHESIRECAVVIQENVDHKDNLSGSKYLAAYYVKNLDLTHSNTENFIRTWETAYQSEYSSLDIDNFKQNTKGWTSSYTNEAIEQEGILEWINATTDRIKQLKPKIVLEIGSGSGLILFNILDSCDYYYATDLSKNVIDYTNNVVHKFGFSDKVSTLACAAGEVPYEQLEKNYDTVIINSVIQYFPSLEYLEAIITNAILNMQDSGQIFIGDIRDFRLLKCFHYSVQTFKRGKTTKAEIDYFSLRDKELLVAPEYFVHLKTTNEDISYVEILPKSGKANHEMNNYRYDVILHIRKNKENNKVEDHKIWVNESDFVKISDAENYITAHLDKDFICIKYLNKRIARDYIEYSKFYNNDYRIDISEYHENLLSIYEMAELSNTKNRNIKCFIDICDPLYLYIVVFKNYTNVSKSFFVDYIFRKSTSKSDLANKPLVTLKLLENQFSNDLKEYLSNMLPSYMIPQRFIPLEKLPLNANGKLDKKALIEIEPEFTHYRNYVAPRNDVEKKICRIWAEVLGLSEEKIGIQDDFFNLGGHSLSALRTLSLTRSNFLIKLPTRALFDYPTVEKFAELIQKIQQDLSFDTRKKFMVSPVITFQKNGFKAPIFLIHPIGGTTFWYKVLSRYLGNNRPVHAIQDPGIDANDFLFEDIKEMANFYMKAIQKIQPSGPYLLAGASFGATIAIEIASQLLKAEEKVSFVGLLDGWPVYSEKFWEKEFFERLMLQQFQRMDPKFINQDINDVQFIQFLLKLQKHRMAMLRFYKIPLVKTKLTFFKAQELWPVFKKIALPTNCWQPYSTEPVEIHKVPGNHETMFWEPHVQVLAKKINQSLNKIEVGEQFNNFERALSSLTYT